MSGYSTAKNTDSYGSIVEALKEELEIVGGGKAISYPYNYKGITQAIENLTFQSTRGPGSDIGPSPEGGSVTIDSNGDPTWNTTTPAADGTLWFDTRQGRLFISYQNEWYQTNGGDGLPVVTPNNIEPSASNLPIGQLWWDASSDDLYIFEGTYKTAAGAIVTTPTADTTPVWIKITIDQGDYFQNTSTLPLYNSTFKDAVAAELADTPTYFPTVDTDTLNVQQDANGYLLDAIGALNKELLVQTITMGSAPPSNPSAGQLWYDTEELDMSIWYLDANAHGQWVPVSAAFMYDEDIEQLKTSISNETTARAARVAELREDVTTLEKSAVTHGATLTSLQGQINNLPTHDLSEYIKSADSAAHIANLQTQVSAARGEIVSIFKSFATENSVTASVQELNSKIDALPTQADLNVLTLKIPNTANLASQAYVDREVSLNAGFKKSGDTLTGTIKINKYDVAKSALDFSDSYLDAYNAFKFETNCPHETRHYVTFGTNENLYEYNWAFSDEEDFCWTHATTGKIASINKDSLAAEKILIGSFLNNDDDGRRLTNTIDVGARLTTYQTALTGMRSAISTSTDYASLKANLLTVLAKV